MKTLRANTMRVDTAGKAVPSRFPGAFVFVYATFAVLVLLSVNFGLNSGVENIANASSPLSTPIQAGLLVVLIGLAARKRGALVAVLPQMTPFLLLLMLAFCSALWSQAPEATLRRSVTLANLMFFALYAHVVLGATQACRAQVAAMWIAAGASLVAAVVVPSSGFDLGEYSRAIRGIFFQKNALGDAMFSGVAALMYLVLRRGRLVWTDVVTILMAGAMIKLSQSTTSLLIFLIIILLMVCALLWMSGTTWAIYGLVLVVLFVSIVFWLITVAPAEFYALLGKNETLTGRAQIWRAVLHATDGWPLLGYGYSAFWLPDAPLVGEIWYAIGWETPNAHSGYLDTMTQIGVVGLVLLAGLAVLTAVFAFRALRQGRIAEGTWALTQLVVIGIINYDESSLPQPNIHIFQWILAFLACSAALHGPVAVAGSEGRPRAARHPPSGAASAAVSGAR